MAATGRGVQLWKTCQEVQTGPAKLVPSPQDNAGQRHPEGLHVLNVSFESKPTQ